MNSTYIFFSDYHKIFSLTFFALKIRVNKRENPATGKDKILCQSMK